MNVQLSYFALWKATLPGAEYFTATAQAQILFSNKEAIFCGTHGFQACPGVF